MKGLLLVLSVLIIHGFSIAQPARFESRGIGGGAELYSTTISPFPPYTIRTSSAESQMFISTDIGASWNAYPYSSLSGGNYAGKIAFTSSAQILYAISSIDGNYVPVKSTDGGRTWVTITDPTFGGAYYLYADPASTNRLIISDYTDVYFSSDGGTSWVFAFSEETQGADGCYIAGALFDGTYIMVATQAGIYTSDDDGATFIKDDYYSFPQETGIVSFTYGQSGALYRLTCLTAPLELLYPGVNADQITSIDELYTVDVVDGILGDWIPRKSLLPNTFLPTHCSMAMNDPSKIFLAGISATGSPMVMKSTNGGMSFTSIFATNNNANITTGWVGSGSNFDWQYAGNPISFTIAQSNPQILAISDFASMHISTDGGNSWKQVYVKNAFQQSAGVSIPKDKSYQTNGLESTNAHCVFWKDSITVFAGYDHIGITRSTDNGLTWSKPLIPNEYQHCYGFVSYQSHLFALVSTVSELYSIYKVADTTINYGKSALLQSTDKGITWTIAHQFDYTASCIIADPQLPSRILVGLAHSTQGGIYVNDDISKSMEWKRLTNPPRTEGHPYNIAILQDGSIVATYSARKSGSIFTTSSGIFHSTDNGNSWVDKSSQAMNVWTNAITVDPHDPYQNTWYVSTWSNPIGAVDNSGGLYRTSNRGVNWEKILTLPQKEHNLYRVNSCTINPSNPNQMFIATASHGLYFTNTLQNAQPVFSELSTTFPARTSQTITFNPKVPWELFVATTGNGLRYGALSIPEIPTITSLLPNADTLIQYKKGNRPELRIIPGYNNKQIVTKAEARFARTRAFDNSDTIDIFNQKVNHIPSNVPGTDSVWYMQSRIGNQSGWSSWSKTLQITMRELSVNGITDSQYAQKLYPNPVHDILTFSDICNCNAEILTITGQSIWKGFIEQSINVHTFPEGAYFVRILGKEMKSIPFIKQDK